jgi:hypothetical protein
VPNHKFKVAHLALVAFVGALILEIVIMFAVGLHETFTVRQIPVHLAALLVGALAGWLFELLREMTATTVATLREAQALTTKITYQNEALDMLITCPTHYTALSQLIKASMSDKFRYIPLIGPPKYLEFLRSAITRASQYEGIQRKPISWFQKDGGAKYLSDLRKQKMRRKVRLFIIDESDRQQWENDLKDPDCLKYYWENTGAAVDTYWMYTNDFLTNFPAWGRTPPKDLALYDRHLLISYDESAQLLFFDVLDDNDKVADIFRSIEGPRRDDIRNLHPLPNARSLSASDSEANASPR